MKTKLDINDIKDKIYLKLTPSGWAIKLRSFIYSKEFDDILIALVKQVNDGKRFTPSLKNIFNAFEQCPYNELKLVLVTHNINHKLESSTGIPYCSDDDNCLGAIYDEINRTIYNNTDSVKRLPDLTHWSKQGILLLNTNLTVTVGNLKYNRDIWDPFYKYLFDILSWNNPGLVYIFQGENKKWDEFINDNNYKLYSSHPFTYINSNEKTWNSNNVFVEAGDIIEKNYNYLIKW